MNNAAKTPAKLFLSVVDEIGRNGAAAAVLDYYEYEARQVSHVDPDRAAAIEAALTFAEGFDAIAGELLQQCCETATAARMVRKMRIAAADSPVYYFPGRCV